jgi:hypothetical protein
MDEPIFVVKQTKDGIFFLEAEHEYGTAVFQLRDGVRDGSGASSAERIAAFLNENITVFESDLRLGPRLKVVEVNEEEG